MKTKQWMLIDKKYYNMAKSAAHNIRTRSGRQIVVFTAKDGIVVMRERKSKPVDVK